MSKKMKGEVKWFNNEKGFGFITSEDGIDFFVHYKDIQSEGFKKLRAKQLVTFEPKKTEKGEQAINVE